MGELFDRRTFLRTAAGVAVGGSLVSAAARADTGPFTDRIYKAVKITMIEGDIPLLDKFKMSIDAGFEGITLFAPDRADLAEAIEARDRTGLVVHNINNAVHWKERLSDPDPAVRARSLEATKAAIQFAHDVGASSILQVIGKVTDPVRENHQQVWERSIGQIRKALPLAAKLGVRILCENVGNGFCEDPETWAEYLDEIDDPWVGALFDIGNHQSRGGSPKWIRALENRIVKLDVKGHNSAVGKNCDILDGDIDWPAVRDELTKLQFTGWATAEVKGGGLERLTEVAQRMDEVLGL